MKLISMYVNLKSTLPMQYQFYSTSAETNLIFTAHEFGCGT